MIRHWTQARAVLFWESGCQTLTWNEVVLPNAFGCCRPGSQRPVTFKLFISNVVLKPVLSKLVVFSPSTNPPPPLSSSVWCPKEAEAALPPFLSGIWSISHHPDWLFPCRWPSGGVQNQKDVDTEREGRVFVGKRVVSTLPWGRMRSSFERCGTQGCLPT